jgi:hypothetical protein
MPSNCMGFIYSDCTFYRKFFEKGENGILYNPIRRIS